MLPDNPHLILDQCLNCKETRYIHKTYQVCKPCFETVKDVSRCDHVEGNPKAIRHVEMIMIDDVLERVVLTCEPCKSKLDTFGD